MFCTCARGCAESNFSHPLITLPGRMCSHHWGTPFPQPLLQEGPLLLLLRLPMERTGLLLQPPPPTSILMNWAISSGEILQRGDEQGGLRIRVKRSTLQRTHTHPKRYALKCSPHMCVCVCVRVWVSVVVMPGTKKAVHGYLDGRLTGSVMRMHTRQKHLNALAQDGERYRHCAAAA